MKLNLFLLCIFICIKVQAKEYVIGVENIDYSPHYNFTDGNKSGYIYDLFELFSANSRHTFKYIALPIKRLRKSLRDNKGVDFMYPDNPLWEEHRSKIDVKTYSKPVINIMGGTMVLVKNKRLTINNIKAISVPHGFTATEWLKIKKKRNLKIFEVPDALSALQLVIKGRVDAADIELNVAMNLLHKIGQKDKLTLAPNLPFAAVSFQLSTVKHPSLITEFNLFLKIHKTKIDKLKRDYQLKESKIN